MYGDLGVKLVQHAKRTQNLTHLPPYQTEIVRAATREVKDLDKDVTDLLEPFQGSFDPSADQAVACTLLVNHLSMRRNKRCLLAYHRTRTDKLEELVWNGCDVVDLTGMQVRESGGGCAPAGGDASTSSLSPQEEEYVRQYGDLLAAYKGQWTDIDLTGSLEPPRDLFIDVRVLKDAGEIQTEYGIPAETRLKRIHTVFLHDLGGQAQNKNDRGRRSHRRRVQRIDLGDVPQSQSIQAIETDMHPSHADESAEVDEARRVLRYGAAMQDGSMDEPAARTACRARFSVRAQLPRRNNPSLGYDVNGFSSSMSAAMHLVVAAIVIWRVCIG
ncbi:hypothetical protein HIM_07106 [Hirsutella minnesotensis 3608]|uniref:DNA replication complex GINS protein PSF1 n=1 Tax=Hirsutella minnesotensis 3608 TaxID=1043627 RepID=A0A0F7ZND3_9HYPO|nr:hypothetical protein HIM_07106 [Hirsutella minnesotensis 3608]